MAKNQKAAKPKSIEAAITRPSKPASKQEAKAKVETQKKEVATSPQANKGVKAQIRQQQADQNKAREQAVVAKAMDQASAENQCLQSEAEVLAEMGVELPPMQETMSPTTPSDPPQCSEKEEPTQDPEEVAKAAANLAALPDVETTQDPEEVSNNKWIPEPLPDVETKSTSDPENTPASNITPQTVKEISTPESAEPEELTRLKMWFGDGHFTHAAATDIITRLTTDVSVMQYPIRWARTDLYPKLPTMLTDTLTSPGFLDAIWPQVALVLGASAGNVTWAAKIAGTIAFFALLEVLPAWEQE
jgi:hypothetical protein